MRRTRKRVPASTDDSRDIRTLYTPMERAVLAAYLGFADPAPADLSRCDVSTPADPDEWNDELDGIAPQASETGHEDLMLENAVARICLESVATELPQWAAIRDGTIERTRKTRRRRRVGRRLRPLHLFTINWGDSGPGFSWPEGYYVTALAGYDVCIVTASGDCPDSHGYCDFAIGWFRATTPDVENAGQCIRSWWKKLTEYGQERWSYLFDAGAVNEETATAWADDVWSDDDNGGDDGDADEDETSIAALEADEDMMTFAPPIPDSYWLTPGRLLAGEYPGAPDDDAARQKLERLLAAGIRSFIDLTETTDPLEPYEPILTELAGELGLDVRYQRLAIRDMSVPTTDVMAAILTTIDSELAAGRPVYFHCWGGIGRTGTVAACWFVGQGHSCDEAFAMLKELRAPTPDGWKESPQTDAQRAFVRGWKP